MCSFISEIENVLKNHADNSAVAYWDDKLVYKTLTYADVTEMCKNITEAIGNFVAEKHICIGLYMEHNPFILALIISLQRCHLSYIFLDPYASDNSNRNIIQKLNIKYIISLNEEVYSTNFLSTDFPEVADLGPNKLKLWKSDLPALHSIKSFETICFVICTSGSTGEPKVIKVEHECIASNITSIRKIFEITENDVIYFGTPLTFDPSMVELFLALTSGCTLVIAPQKIKINPIRLLDILFPKEDNIHKGVTVLQIVPSLFLRWSQATIEFILQKSSCRILAFGGERFPEVILNFLKSETLRIFNLYGVTEVSCWASAIEVSCDTKSVSLGNPLDDTILEVRNNKGLKITRGEGELHIGSSSRVCYVNDENKSLLKRPVFRSTGDIVKITNEGYFYICRNNFIVKRFGHRINLLEVEDQIFKHTTVPNTCIWLEDANKLVVFVAIDEHNALTRQKIADKFRVKLLHSLPKHYLPDHIELISSFPLSSHGKVDRQALVDLYNKIICYPEKSLKLEDSVEIFQLLCCKYLGLSFTQLQKYLDYNFFEIGGNSIITIQLLSEYQNFVEIPDQTSLTTSLFEKTLKDCCRSISNCKLTSKKKWQSSIEDSDNKTKRKKPSTTQHNSIKMQICWKYNLQGCIDSSPTLIEERDTALIAVGSFSHIFVVLDAETGKIISQTVLPDAIESSCCGSLTSNLIFVGCYDGNMYAIESTSGNIAWKYETSAQIKCTPCLCLTNEAIVFGSYDKHVHCVDIQSGTQRWKTLLSESVTSNIIPYKEHIYVATTFGTCLCLVEENGNILWKHILGVPIFGAPCLSSSNDKAIVWPAVNGILYSFCCTSGEEQWTFKANGSVYSSLLSYEDFIVFGCDDHNIYCIQVQLNICSLKYKVLLNSAVYSTPHILKHQENVYVVAASTRGSIYVIELNSGEVIEDLQLPGEIFSSPAIRGNYIYIGCRDNNFYCLKIANSEINK